MGAVHGSNADFYMNGYVLSEYLNSATFSGTRDAAETTTFKKKSKTYLPGPKDSTMAAEGIFDGLLDQSDQILNAAFNADPDSLVSYLPEGNEVAGRPAISLLAVSSSYEVNTEIADVSQIAAEFSAGKDGMFSRGKVVRPWAVAPAASQSPYLDHGVVGTSTDRGGLVVHATASASLVVKYQHSTDNVTFTDLPGSLSFGSTRGSLRLAIPTMVINRYTRVIWTGTGSFVAILER